MSKQEFLEQLRKGLCGLPQDEIEERLTFYSEMIDDRIEEGLSEAEAVSGIGSVNSIVSQIVAEVPLTKLVKEKITPKKKLKIWEIVLLALGSPMWLSLLLAAFAVVLAIYVSLWSLLISLWCVFGSFVVGALGGIVAGGGLAFCGSIPSGIALMGAGFACAGFSVFSFFGCKAATKGTLSLTSKLLFWTKNLFIKKEEA